jgi:hypothetical protein
VTEITHITPHFFPQIDGLGDYARLLGEELRRSHGMESRVVVGDPEWKEGGSGTSSQDVRAVPSRSPEALLALLGDPPTVVLHYVGYGYHVRGVPFWITKAMRRWKEVDSNRKLIVVFHELWASGPPWKSEFYLGFIQRRLVAELHRMCDAALTSTPLMVRRLEAIHPGKTIFQPIPSNLPTLPLDQRVLHHKGPAKVIVFGQEASRLLSIQAHAPLLRALHQEGLLAEIRVVGKGVEAGGTPSADVRLLRTFLPREIISAASNVSPAQGTALLGLSDLFLSYYPSAFVCKSGALMAALGCGCVPILPEATKAKPLAEGRELLACDGSEEQIRLVVDRVRSAGLANLAEAGWNWYQRNASIEVVGSTVAGLLRRLPTSQLLSHQ